MASRDPIRSKVQVHPYLVTKDITRADLRGLNVVFINMPLRETAKPNTTPEGLLLMATRLRNEFDVNASVIDLNAYRIQDKKSAAMNLPMGRHLTKNEVRRLIARHFEVHGMPDLVGLSGMITTLRWQEIVAKMIRGLAPDTFLVSGNGLATELKTGLFEYIPTLDAVAHSEGDDVVIKICYDAKKIKEMGFAQALNAGKLEPYYLGFKNRRHRFLYAGDRPKNLNVLPYADLELLRADVLGNPLLSWYLDTPAWGAAARNSSATPFDTWPKTTSVSSRGCPFACNYCFRGSQGERDWGVRSPEHLFEEFIAHIDRYNIKFKSYPDDNFAVRTDRIEALVPLIGPLGVPWGTHTRNDEGADYEKISAMARAGCKYIGFGPESADEQTLIALGKGGQTLKRGFEEVTAGGKSYRFPIALTQSIRNCIEFGIHANCTWIMASPGETLERLKNTVGFMMWQDELYSTHGIPTAAVNKNMFTLTWYPGTEMIKHERVRSELGRVFGLTFEPSLSRTAPWEPVCDAAFYKYLIELDDATKVLHGTDDEPLNFGAMSTDQFLEARSYVDSGNIYKILDM